MKVNDAKMVISQKARAAAQDIVPAVTAYTLRQRKLTQRREEGPTQNVMLQSYLEVAPVTAITSNNKIVKIKDLFVKLFYQN